MRYLGTKSKILPIIDEFIRKNNIAHDGDIFCDAFSGTGVVGDYFKNRFHIISNDSLYASYAVSTAKLINPDSLFATLGFCPFDFFNRQNTHDYIQGFCYNNFAPTISGRMYFSDENAKLIDLSFRALALRVVAFSRSLITFPLPTSTVHSSLVNILVTLAVLLLFPPLILCFLL